MRIVNANRISRADFFKMVGLSAAGIAAASLQSRAKAAAPPAEIAEFCYPYDTDTTMMEAIEVNKPYVGVPKPLSPHNPVTYIQPWDDYNPDCTLEDQTICPNLPSQTANIKPLGVYEGIEVGDNEWIQMACEEARLAVEAGAAPFAAVIVQIDNESNNVIRYWRNHNHAIEWNDPTAHGEVSTIRAACKQLGTRNLGEIHKEQSKMLQPGAISHCEMYSAVELCPMCYAASSWAHLPVIVFAATRYDAAVQGVTFSDEQIYAELAKPYKDRKMVKSYQSSTPNSLDAFNLWKRSQ